MDKIVAAANSNTEGVTTPRWKPTLQQKEILEDIYRSGTHSPSVEDIERITSVLKGYGGVEGKNVFYWFQNFNAKEKLQRKRALQSSQSLTGSSQSLIGDDASTSTTLSIQNQIGIGDQLESPRMVIVKEESEYVCNNSQVCQTLELFPLEPDGGGLGRSLNTRSG